MRLKLSIALGLTMLFVTNNKVALTTIVTTSNTPEPTAQKETTETLVSAKSESLELYTFNNTGKVRFRHIYTPILAADMPQPVIDNGLRKAMEQQIQVLSQKPKGTKYKIGNLTFSVEDLKRTVELLTQMEGKVNSEWANNFDIYQLWGRDGKGNVRFTAYYTPIINASLRKEGEYQHPFYVYPKNGSETANLYFAKSNADIHSLRLQGSGYVQVGVSKIYVGMTHKVVDHRIMASNLNVEETAMLVGQKSKAITKKAFTFVKSSKNRPSGASATPLLADYSIAVDTRYIPLGSILLAYVPTHENGKTKYVYRFLLAQDTGGAIKGAGHIDLYKGIGGSALKKSLTTNHNGKLWLLLPKRRPS